MPIFQQSNHNIQQSLLEEWMKSHPDFYILNFTTFKQRLKNQSIVDISTVKSSIIGCSKTQYYKTIFSNKYFSDIKEKNIDGKGKRIKEDIEEKILAEYRNQKSYLLSTIHDYFSLQLTRSDSVLLDSYSVFLSLFGEIKDIIDYNCFKEFYNSFLIPGFIKIKDKFLTNNYQFLYYACPSMIDSNNNKISPYLWIGEANVFELSKLGLDNYTDDFNIDSIKNIYVCLLSPSELIFLYHSMYDKEYIKKLADNFTNYWNNVALGLLCKTLIFPKRSIDTVSNAIMELYNNPNYFINNEELAKLEDLSKKYELKNK